MLKKYPRIEALIHKAGAEVGAWLLAAASFVVVVWLVKIIFGLLRLAV